MTKVIFKIITLTALFIAVHSLTSCDSGNDELSLDNTSQSEGGPNNGGKLAGTKWTNRSWDYAYDLDSDAPWAYAFEDITIITFINDSEGTYYSARKTYDTDTGKSRTARLAHFQYAINNDKVVFDYITLQYQEFPNSINYSNGTIYVAEQNDLNKAKINYNDQKFYQSLKGTTGSCGWYKDLSGVLKITGEGRMADYSSYEHTPWYSEWTPVNYVEIGDGITYIGANCFSNVNITTVNFSNSRLTSIGENAFAGSLIKSIWHFPDGITTIGKSAFAGCKYLDIFLPDNIETIGEHAFESCKGVNMSDTDRLKYIGSCAFMDTKVNYFTPSQVLEHIGSAAFTDFNGNLTLPDSMRELSEGAFMGCSLGKIFLGQNLTGLSKSPFIKCNPTEIHIDQTIPPSVSEPLTDNYSQCVLYVPLGAKDIYSKTQHWNQYKKIAIDETLHGDLKISDEYNNLYYTIDGIKYNFILVEGAPKNDFKIMQTELPPSAVLCVNGNELGKLDKNGDNVVIQAEFTSLLEDLKDATGLDFQLPTRQEWMFAAKGGKKADSFTYSGSNDIDDVAWYSSNAKGSVHKPAQLKANSLGLYDMSGNYAEVCYDTSKGYRGVDGPICGGSFRSTKSNCMITSYIDGITTGKVGNTTKSEKNAFDARYNTIRLICIAPGK